MESGANARVVGALPFERSQPGSVPSCPRGKPSPAAPECRGGRGEFHSSGPSPTSRLPAYHRPSGLAAKAQRSLNRRAAVERVGRKPRPKTRTSVASPEAGPRGAPFGADCHTSPRRQRIGRLRRAAVIVRVPQVNHVLGSRRKRAAALPKINARQRISPDRAGKTAIVCLRAKSQTRIVQSESEQAQASAVGAEGKAAWTCPAWLLSRISGSYVARFHTRAVYQPAGHEPRAGGMPRRWRECGQCVPRPVSQQSIGAATSQTWISRSSPEDASRVPSGLNASDANGSGVAEQHTDDFAARGIPQAHGSVIVSRRQ